MYTTEWRYVWPCRSLKVSRTWGGKVFKSQGLKEGVFKKYCFFYEKKFNQRPADFCLHKQSWKPPTDTIGKVVVITFTLFDMASLESAAVNLRGCELFIPENFNGGSSSHSSASSTSDPLSTFLPACVACVSRAGVRNQILASFRHSDCLPWHGFIMRSKWKIELFSISVS